MKNTNNNPLSNSNNKGTKKDYCKQLFDVLYNEPMSRRMAISKVGYLDQTYMATQPIYDWIKQGKAFVIGIIKCNRSGRKVEMITTNPELFPCSSQFNLFESIEPNPKK